MTIDQIQQKQNELQAEIDNIMKLSGRDVTKLVSSLFEYYQAEIDKLLVERESGKMRPTGEFVDTNKKEEWPKRNDGYFYISASGEIFWNRWSGHNLDRGRKKQGNIARTREELKMEAKRREARAERWLAKSANPEKNYYHWNFNTEYENKMRRTYYYGNNTDIAFYHMGNMFPYTDQGKKACQAWGEKYGEAFKLKT